MNDEEIKKAEHLGYAKGYRAGRARKVRDGSEYRRYREKQAFLDRAFLALLPVAMSASGWKFGEKEISSTAERVRLAVAWSREAMLQRPAP